MAKKKTYTAIEQLYGKWVISGKKSIEQVPASIRDNVQSYVNEVTGGDNATDAPAADNPANAGTEEPTK